MERVILGRIGGALAIAATVFVASCSTSNIGTSVTLMPSPETAPVAKPAPPAVMAPVAKPRTNTPIAVVKPASVAAPAP